MKEFGFPVANYPNSFIGKTEWRPHRGGGSFPSAQIEPPCDSRRTDEFIKGAGVRQPELSPLGCRQSWEGRGNSESVAP